MNAELQNLIDSPSFQKRAPLAKLREAGKLAATQLPEDRRETLEWIFSHPYLSAKDKDNKNELLRETYIIGGDNIWNLALQIMKLCPNDEAVHDAGNAYRKHYYDNPDIREGVEGVDRKKFNPRQLAQKLTPNGAFDFMMEALDDPQTWAHGGALQDICSGTLMRHFLLEKRQAYALKLVEFQQIQADMLAKEPSNSFNLVSGVSEYGRIDVTRKIIETNAEALRDPANAQGMQNIMALALAITNGTQIGLSSNWVCEVGGFWLARLKPGKNHFAVVALDPQSGVSHINGWVPNEFVTSKSAGWGGTLDDACQILQDETDHEDMSYDGKYQQIACYGISGLAIKAFREIMDCTVEHGPPTKANQMANSAHFRLRESAEHYEARRPA